MDPDHSNAHTLGSCNTDDAVPKSFHWNFERRQRYYESCVLFSLNEDIQLQFLFLQEDGLWNWKNVLDVGSEAYD
ncbi:hypothetical protein Csa_013224 [Cucumis sativus]|nr:hypothetical protein Csa_013224 [Cucumis sativus]